MALFGCVCLLFFWLRNFSGLIPLSTFFLDVKRLSARNGAAIHIFRGRRCRSRFSQTERSASRAELFYELSSNPLTNVPILCIIQYPLFKYCVSLIKTSWTTKRSHSLFCVKSCIWGLVHCISASECARLLPSLEVQIWDERIFFPILIHTDSQALVIIPAPFSPLISLNAGPF